jgi:catechol 2,3-dioxygenase-like lactoylglutathione lyase family enzyme
MLGRYPIYVVLLSTDLDETRAFYHEKLGLEIISDDEAEIVFRTGDTEFSVTKSTTGTADAQTKAGWRVDDVGLEVAELRSKGVAVQDYDMPGSRRWMELPTWASPLSHGSSIRMGTLWAFSSPRDEARSRLFRRPP